MNFNLLDVTYDYLNGPRPKWKFSTDDGYPISTKKNIAYDKVEYKGVIVKYAIKKIIVNDGAVVVIFKDNNKVVVKRMSGDKDDIYSAVAQAVMKKMYGGTATFHKRVDQLVVLQKKKENKDDDA